MPPVLPELRSCAASGRRRAIWARAATMSGCEFGPAAREILRDLALQLGDLAGGGAAIVAAQAGNGLRGGGELAAHRGERGICRSDLLVEARHLGARRIHPVVDRAGAGQLPHIALLELDPVLLRLAKRGLAAGQLLVEHLQALTGFLPVTAHILFLEGVDQALDGAGRGARILAVGETGNVGGRLDLQPAIRLLRHRDAQAQGADDRGQIAVIGDQRIEVGAADDANQILVRDEGLLQAQHLRIAIFDRAAGKVGEHLLLLDEQARLRLIAVRNERDDQPAEHGHAPGDGGRKPAAAPHLVHGNPDLAVESIH